VVSFPTLVEALQRRDVRFVLIGIWGVNAHASDGAAIFATHADTLRQMLRDDEDRR